MRRMIWVTTQFEGFHKWENAPGEVAFLRNLHRHIFKVKVMIDVRHDDREIEFFMFKWMLEEIVREQFEKKEVGSCEMIAAQILNWLMKKYPDRDIVVEVSEDGENGARVSLR